MTDKNTLTPIPPVQVSVIGTGDGGGSPLTTGTEAKTPDHQPNLVITVIQPVVAIAVRAAYTFFTNLSGSMAGMGLGTGVMTMEQAVLNAAIATGIGAIKDCATIFGRLESEHPLLTGSV